MAHHPAQLDHNQSVLAQLREPQQYPELIVLRERLAGWRFYHQFRSDADAPSRGPQIAVRTPVLADDGRDLVPALRTIHEQGDADRLRAALDRVLPGWRFNTDRSTLWIEFQPVGLFKQCDLRAASDGTLRFVCLAAALLSLRPPELLVLNEPENSLHPQLLDPLAELIAAAECQLWVTTHSVELAQAIAARTGEEPVALAMQDGRTQRNT